MIPHETYAEVFVGMGGVFLRREVAARCEVINDLSSEVATLFRVLAHHFDEFTRSLGYKVASREEFDRALLQDPALLTDIQKAVRFYYLQSLAFGGRPRSRSFSVRPPAPVAFEPAKVSEDLREVHERLAKVSVENLDYAEFIDRYDRAGTLFYLDPPYFGGEADYGKGLFERADFARMAEQLRSIKGDFLLSINDVPEIREVFTGFHFEEVRLKYSVASGDATPAAELIISNREPESKTEIGQGSLL